MSASPGETKGGVARIGSTLQLPSGSPWPVIRVMEYDAERLVESEIEDPAELVPHANAPTTTWIDIQGLGDEDRLRAVAGILGVHEAALADAVNVPQRAKTQSYGDYLLVVIRAPQDPFHAGDAVPQVCLLIAGSNLVTFQERYFGFFDEVRNRIRDPQSLLRQSGPAFLAYSLASRERHSCRSH